MSKGLTFDRIEAVFDGMPISNFEKAVAKSRLRNATTYQYSHQLIEAVRKKIGMSVDDLRAAWLVADGLR